MLSHNKPKRGITLRKEIHKTTHFRVRWRQAVTSDGEIIDIGAFEINERHHKGS